MIDGDMWGRRTNAPPDRPLNDLSAAPMAFRPSNGRRYVMENAMAKRPSREQIAMAIVKTGASPKSYDETLAVLKTKTLKQCRYIPWYYPSVRAAMTD